MPLLDERLNVQAVGFLLALCHAGGAAALGLGELDLRSGLGQPLHAAIDILGATADTHAECFSLSAGAGTIAPPLHASLTLERSGARTLLHIRTRATVNDPIAQFVLTSDCEARLQRDYVVLLDPPATVAETAEDERTVVAVTPPSHAVSAVRAPAPLPMPATRAAPRPSKRVRPGPAPAPRLVLSGRRTKTSETAAPSFALRLDTELPDLARPAPPTLSEAELSDENTALTRKLAHLESQLLALARRNAELDAAYRATQAAAPPTAPDKPAQWPLYLLLAGLLSGGAATLAWQLRRRAGKQALGMAGVAATPALATEKTLVETLATLTSEPIPQRMAEVGRPPGADDDGTEVKDGILDQAEVFMAHGHANLAIHLLQEHLRQAPTESPVPWLLLLDLLHRAGDAPGYAAASAECRRYFNVNLSGHPFSQDGDGSEGLEAYPHLLEQLVHVWRSAEREAFFRDLIYDHRGGTRMGFKPAAYRDILLLRAVADAIPLAEAA